MQDNNPTEYTREAQEALHAKWEASGQSQAAFCKDHNIPYNKFSYWHKRALSNKIKSKPYFAPGKVLGGSARDASPVGRLVLPSGIRVDVFSEAALLSLIKEAVLGK